MWYFVALPVKMKLSQFSYEEPTLIHVHNISVVENSEHKLLI